MSGLWDSIRDVAGRAGSAAGAAAEMTRLKTELLLVERELTARKSAFGVELYDYVSPLTRQPHFYASDDTLTVTLQPPLITAQREISALSLKKAKLQEEINQAAVTRAAAFKPATNWQERLKNAGKSTVLAGNEAKLTTEMALIKGEIKHYKQQFGIQLYVTLEELEDTQQWLPTDREIRSIYDNCRRDIEIIKARKDAKEEELNALESGTATTNETEPEIYTSPVPNRNAAGMNYNATSSSVASSASATHSATFHKSNGTAVPSPSTTPAVPFALAVPVATASATALPHSYGTPVPSHAPVQQQHYNGNPQQQHYGNHPTAPDPFAPTFGRSSSSHGTQQPHASSSSRIQEANNLFAGMASGSQENIPIPQSTGYTAPARVPPTTQPDRFATFGQVQPQAQVSHMQQLNNNGYASNNTATDPFASLASQSHQAYDPFAPPSANNTPAADPFASFGQQQWR